MMKFSSSSENTPVFSGMVISLVSCVAGCLSCDIATSLVLSEREEGRTEGERGGGGGRDRMV